MEDSEKQRKWQMVTEIRSYRVSRLWSGVTFYSVMGSHWTIMSIKKKTLAAMWTVDFLVRERKKMVAVKLDRDYYNNIVKRDGGMIEGQ